MIDKICYWFFGKLDTYSQLIDKMFIEFPKEPKSKKNNQYPKCEKDFGCERE